MFSFCVSFVFEDIRNRDLKIDANEKTIHIEGTKLFFFFSFTTSSKFGHGLFMV